MSPPSSRSRLPVVVVGQTPPPVHGQALAIGRLVRADLERVEVHHVPMDFSSSMAEVGRVRPRKLFRLVRLIWRVLRFRFTTGARVLYYPPAGPRLVPVLRDLLILSLIRPFFPTVILDLHAGGLQDMEGRLIGPLRILFRHAYHDASLVIERYPQRPESAVLPARRRRVVPYGVPDKFPRFRAMKRDDGVFTVLYVGLVTGGKGVWTLLEAITLLDERGVEARAVVVGEFASARAEAEWSELLRRPGLRSRVRHTGRLVGIDKWHEFRCADVFCFPSHYENEAFPLAIIEAMQFGLPIIGSDWRGIPHLVQEGVNGFVVPPRDPAAVADRLEKLASDPVVRKEMSARAREIFLERYTVEAYLKAMELALVSATDAPDGG